MKWTDKPPTKPGWYWLRIDGKHIRVTKVRPIMENDDGLYATIRSSRLVPVNFNHDEDMEGTEWAGPIPEPEEKGMNNETLRTSLAALGRALVETFGDQPAQAAPAPLPALVQEPVKAEPAPEDQPKRKVFIAKTFACSDCGRRFEANASHAKRCPECRQKLRGAKLVELSNRKRQNVNLWDGPATDADMVYSNSIDM